MAGLWKQVGAKQAMMLDVFMDKPYRAGKTKTTSVAKTGEKALPSVHAAGISVWLKSFPLNSRGWLRALARA
jgi:hypothetical protein